jgi:hypothetical protein
MSYLGLNQINCCRCFLNTWRNTAASVGLDLDSSALWAMVLYFGHGFGQDPLKIIVNISVPETAVIFLKGLDSDRTLTKLDPTPA